MLAPADLAIDSIENLFESSCLSPTQGKHELFKI